MRAEDGIDLPELAEGLNRLGVRYLVIGGQAVLLHGIPLHSFDFDIWVDPSSRVDVLSWLEDELGFELSSGPLDARPIVTAYAGADRIDIFFARAMTNRDGVTIRLDEALARAQLYADEASGGIPFPSIDDLIDLKRMSAAPRTKDEEAIKLLLAKKLLIDQICSPARLADVHDPRLRPDDTCAIDAPQARHAIATSTFT